MLSKENEYSEYKKISPEHYKYINFILDDGRIQNLANTLENDKFILFKGKMEPGYTKEHQIKFFIDNGETTNKGAPNDISGSVLALDIYLDATAYDKNINLAKSLKQELLAKSNSETITDYNSGNKGELFTFSHPEAEQTMGWTDDERKDYRFIGNAPNNYINFNNEIWRIIGIFTVEGNNGEKEQRIKIVRDQSIGGVMWNSEPINEWVGSTIETTLNNRNYNWSSTYSSGSLKSYAISQIVETKWYLGALEVYSNARIRLPVFNTEKAFSYERGLKTCATEGNCLNETRNTSTFKEVGLMYLSDYLFTFSNGVDETCFNNGLNCSEELGGNPNSSWIYSKYTELLITPLIIDNSKVTQIISGGSTFAKSADLSYFDTRPVVYLRSDIMFTSGDGTSPKTAYILE